jgi:hypothetical protein
MPEAATTDKDLGYNAILREMGRARNSWVDVGYWGEKAHGDGEPTIPYIASVHEFGTKPGTEPVIPERSFIRSTADENRQKYQELLDKGLLRIIMRKGTVKSVLAGTGEIILSDIRAKLTKGDPQWPPLAESTIAGRKHGGTQPLFDTGTLAKSGGTRVVIDGAQVLERGRN